MSCASFEVNRPSSFIRRDVDATSTRAPVARFLLFLLPLALSHARFRVFTRRTFVFSHTHSIARVRSFSVARRPCPRFELAARASL